MTLPEGWFVSIDEEHDTYFPGIKLRHIRIQNGTTPTSKALVFSCTVQDFSYERAQESLTKAIREYEKALTNDSISV